MTLFRREARAAGNPFFEPPIPPVYGGTGGGMGLTTPGLDRAMQMDAVWACVRLLGDTVSMMPLHGYTLDAQGVRVPMEQDPPLIRQPGDDATLPDWLYMTMTSLLLRGNSYDRIVARDRLGYPTQVDKLHPDLVTPVLDDNKRPAFRINGDIVPRMDILHVRAYRMPGSRAGLSPVAYHARTINTDAAAGNFAQGFFQDGAHPSAILSSDQPINQDQAVTIKQRFQAAVKGREPAVMGAGMTYTPIQVSPEESQFLATQKYNVAKIARVFGVPPEMIAGESGNSMTYANVEQRGIDFLTYSVQAWLTRLETALTPLLPGVKHVKFDASALLRTDYETLMKANSIGIASKQLTVDESRAMFDRPPLTAKQKRDLELVPLEVSPTGMPRKVPGAPAPATPAPDASTQTQDDVALARAGADRLELR